MPDVADRPAHRRGLTARAIARTAPARARRQPLEAPAAELGRSPAQALPPAEAALAGAGLTIAWGRFESPFGPALLLATGRGICGLGFPEPGGEAAVLAGLAARWPAARLAEDPARLRPLAKAAFAAPAPVPDAPLDLVGPPFHVRVWEALRALPPGRVTSYGDLACAAGAPGAARAVGQAVGANPVAWLVPCHRVLRASGALGGYRWGLVRKEAMLAWEAAQCRPAAGAGDGQGDATGDGAGGGTRTAR